MHLLAAALTFALQFSAAPPREKVARPARDHAGDEIDVSRLPPEQKARYPLVRQKCTACHPLSRATNSRLSSAEWKRHVKRMARRPATALSDDQVESIIGFLEYYSSRRGRE
jgi:hypothetical protein